MNVMTEAQFNQRSDELKGQRVEWSGWVEDVNEKLLGGYELWVDMDDPSILISVQDVQFDIPDELALQLQKDQRVDFTGTIRSIINLLGSTQVTLENVSVQAGEPAPTPTQEIDNGQSVVEPAQNPVIGEDVIVGAVRWRVLEAQRLGNRLDSDNQFIDPLVTNEQFILVRVEVENRDNDSRTFFEGDIADDQGRTFKSVSASSFIENSEWCLLEQLNPNIAKICTNIYEVSQDASGFRLVVGDLAFFGDEAEIDLQLE